MEASRAIIRGKIDYENVRPVLIIAPHADDEAVGCGGLISRLTERNVPVEVVVFATPDGLPGDRRMKELAAAMDTLRVQKYRVQYPGGDAYMDRAAMKPMVTAMDLLLQEVRPCELYYSPGDHHQDHVVVEKVMRAALRPWAFRTLKPPTVIAMYEIITLYTVDRPHSGYMYVGFYEEDLMRKLDAISCYESQLGGAGAVSLEIVRLAARIRGLESGHEYAERFRVVKIRR